MPSKNPRVGAGTRKKLIIPAYFLAALRKNKTAQTAFENFSHSHQKEYVNWIREAKREETRERRIKSAIERLAAGKPQN